MYAVELSEKRGKEWPELISVIAGLAILEGLAEFGDWMAAKLLGGLTVSGTNEIFNYQPQNCTVFHCQEEFKNF